jgi:hypothetical protein
MISVSRFPMNPDRFVKIFDVVDAGFRNWTFPAFGLIFVAIGLVMAFFPSIIKATGIPFLEAQSKFQKAFRFVFLSFAVLWTVIAFSTTYSQHLRQTSLAQENRCSVVEGPVEHFVPMPYGGHAVESFAVKGIPFSYSDFIITGGFNNASSHGGPIDDKSYVRICYDPSRNVILRLEIRDFKGELKDYGWRNFSLFPKAEDFQKAGGPAIHIPWYSNLIVPLYLLDLVAIQMLFLPYLRTFLRVKTISDWDRAIPDLLEAGTKIKLRSSMIYWDKEDHAIWLRPRGLVLIQIPMMVAKLIVDSSNKSILGCEIRFSSGFPFVLTFMLWIAYQFFMAVPMNGAHGPPPAVFAAMGGLVVLIGWINLRMLRSRMEKLVEDAVAELNGM